MKPMAGMGGMKMGGMEMPKNAPTVPAVTGYSEGQEILFMHTEASDPKIAKILTGAALRACGSRTSIEGMQRWNECG